MTIGECADLEHDLRVVGRRRVIPGGVVVEDNLGVEEVFKGVDFIALTGALTIFGMEEARREELVPLR
ncbi:hypothetical protein KY289_030588 [Solanum tuberosum]|nr:hypothetical protein KY289_030588 [Solanum tuberosum]